MQAKALSLQEQRFAAQIDAFAQQVAQLGPQAFSGVMAAKKLPDDDARARKLIHKTVLGSLNRATDTIERVEAAGSVAWRVI